MRPFSVELAGSFYTYNLYNEDGKQIFDLMEAADRAEELYEIDWQGVYNGNEGIGREDYVFCVQNSDNPE